MVNWMKYVAAVLAVVGFANIANAQVTYGDDTSEYANDSECDDRRFMGSGIAMALDEADNGRDATDCEKLHRAGMVQLVDKNAGIAATDCDAIDFGDDSSEWSRDGECDDPRFDGPGTASIISLEDLLGDAKDCRSQCNNGRIWLRVPAAD